MSVLMAIVDYFPVTLFLIAAIVLQRELYYMMSKGAFALFSTGTITVFVAGFFKATWKLLYALGVCDFVALSQCFFPMQTVGFVLAAAGVVAMLSHRQGKGTAYGVAVVPFTSSMPFVVLMVLGVAVLNTSLCVVAKRRKCTGAIVLYLVAFVFIMGMGYLSSRDFADPAMNWLAEGVNTIGQGSFLAASLLLKKAKA